MAPRSMLLSGRVLAPSGGGAPSDLRTATSSPDAATPRPVEVEEAPTVGHRPTAAEIELARYALAPWRWLTSPVLSGVEHIPRDRPVMLAGNHTIWAARDS